MYPCVYLCGRNWLAPTRKSSLKIPESSGLSEFTSTNKKVHNEVQCLIPTGSLQLKHLLDISGNSYWLFCDSSVSCAVASHLGI